MIDCIPNYTSHHPFLSSLFTRTNIAVGSPYEKSACAEEQHEWEKSQVKMRLAVPLLCLIVFPLIRLTNCLSSTMTNFLPFLSCHSLLLLGPKLPCVSVIHSIVTSTQSLVAHYVFVWCLCSTWYPLLLPNHLSLILVAIFIPFMSHLYCYTLFLHYYPTHIQCSISSFHLSLHPYTPPLSSSLISSRNNSSDIQCTPCACPVKDPLWNSLRPARTVHSASGTLHG